MSKEYNPYFEYKYQPPTKEDPIPHCIKTEPYDLSKCNWGRRKSRFVYEPPKLKLYHDGPSISYSEGKGFPEPSNPNSSYYPVNELTKDHPPLHILDNGDLECSKPTFTKSKEGRFCKELETSVGQEPTCSFKRCDLPDPRFGMAESIYRMYPNDYQKFQTRNWWHNLASKDFIENGSYEYVDKQEWGTAPWSLGEYSAPRLCPGDSYEEWRTDADRCWGEYKICHNVFNNMTRRKSIL